MGRNMMQKGSDCSFWDRQKFYKWLNTGNLKVCIGVCVEVMGESVGDLNYEIVSLFYS